jgi:hypothetical protein
MFKVTATFINGSEFSFEVPEENLDKAVSAMFEEGALTVSTRDTF